MIKGQLISGNGQKSKFHWLKQGEIHWLMSLAGRVGSRWDSAVVTAQQLSFHPEHRWALTAFPIWPYSLFPSLKCDHCNSKANP